MANETMIPQIRFPEFNGNWKPNLLGEIAVFSKGKGISKSEIDKDGEIECIRYGELYTEYSETISTVKSRTNVSRDELVFSEANDVIIPASGETQIDIATASCILRDGIALGGDLNIIKSKTNGVFLSYYLNNGKKKDIAQLAQGISVVHLYASQLKELKLTLPKPEEQTKIAYFIAKVDNQIQLLEKEKALLEQYKKGISQKIFNQEIRFKDDNGNDFPDWEEKALGDVLDYEQPTKYLVSDTEYSNEYSVPVLTAGKTFLLGYTKEDYGIFSEKLPTIIFDDFTTAFQFVDFPFKAKSSAMKMLIPEHDSVNLKFVFEVMKTIKFPLSEHKRYWISEYQLEKIPYPHPEEQIKIAMFFSDLDNLIEKTDIQVRKSKSFKKGLLQKMFV